MTTTEEHISAIRKAIEAGPTPGEWKSQAMHFDGRITHVVGESDIVDGLDGICEPDRINDRTFEESRRNMDFIAACNPAAITAVLSEIDRLKEENERMRDDEAKLRGQGMAIAAGILVKGLGEETYATEIMGAAGYKSVADLEADGVDEYDINILRHLFETAALKGESQ